MKSGNVLTGIGVFFVLPLAVGAAVSWLYALPPEALDACPFQLVDFAGGLYAAAVSVDQDDGAGGGYSKYSKASIRSR